MTSPNNQLAEPVAERAEMLKPAGLSAAIAAFAESGIDFRAPWQCDLDDLERERFGALCAAIGAYIAASASEPVAWLHTLNMELGQKQRRLTFEASHPFGLPGNDYSPEFTVTSEPLILAGASQ